MRRRPVTVTAVLLGLVVAALPVSGVTATHNTEHCRNEPGDPNEEGVSVSDSGGEIAFVGADTDYPPGGGVLVCADVLGVNTNVGYVPGADIGLVRDCSPSRPVTADECRMSADVVAVDGFGVASPGIDPLFAQFQTITVDFMVTTVGAVKGGLSVLDVSQCDASLASTVAETYALGAGNGVWGCFSGPLDGMGGGLTYARGANVTGITLGGSLSGALACVTTNPQPQPPNAITSFAISCAGGGAS